MAQWKVAGATHAAVGAQSAPTAAVRSDADCNRSGDVLDAQMEAVLAIGCRSCLLEISSTP
jgi:hypothetical protein